MNNKNYNLRKAGLLDISFIFYLIMDGSFEGAFTDLFLTSNGYFLALIYLLLAVLRPLRFLKYNKEVGELFIFTLNDEDIGFLKIKKISQVGHAQVIELCAIAPEQRNQKHGTKMIRTYLDSLTIGTEVMAYCTKYSRAMQHIFVKQQFIRDKNSYPLECYRFRKKTDTLSELIPLVRP